MDELKSLFGNKKNVINLLLLGIMVLAIPLTFNLVRQQQIIRSQAAEARIEFLTEDKDGTECVVLRDNQKVAVCADVKVKFIAPTVTAAGQTVQLFKDTLYALVSKVYAAVVTDPNGDKVVYQCENPGGSGSIQYRTCRGTDCGIYGDWTNLSGVSCSNGCQNIEAVHFRDSSGDTWLGYREAQCLASPAPSPSPQPSPPAPTPDQQERLVYQCSDPINESGWQNIQYRTCTGSTCPGWTNLRSEGTEDDVVCTLGCRNDGTAVHANDTWIGYTSSSCRTSPPGPTASPVPTPDQQERLVYQCSDPINESGWQNIQFRTCTGSTCPDWTNLQSEGTQDDVVCSLGCQNVGNAIHVGPQSTFIGYPDASCRTSGGVGTSCTVTSSCTGTTCSFDHTYTVDEVVQSKGSYRVDLYPDRTVENISTGFVSGNDPLSHTYTPGTYTARLKVQKNDGTGLVFCESEQFIVASPAPVINQFRYAQDPTELAQAEYEPYAEGGVIREITLVNTEPGQTNTVFVQFKDDQGNEYPRVPGNITFVGPDPDLTGLACDINLDLRDGSLLFRARGENFGPRGNNARLKADDANLEIRQWTPTLVAGRLANPPDTTAGRTYTVTLTRSDGVSSSGTCDVATMQISLGAELFCRTPRNFDQNNVALSIFEVETVETPAAGSATPRRVISTARETVTVNREGIISNIRTKLQEGVKYVLCVKAPRSLRRCSEEIEAISGNNIIKQFALPVGDLNGDDKINTVDAASLRSQWGVVTASKNCDFNRDGVCNSFEWACMRHDFNAPVDSEPQ